MKTWNIGMVGLDTSHASAFTRLLHDPSHPFHVAGGRIRKAFPGGSENFSLSRSRIGTFSAELSELGVELVSSIAKLDGLDAYFLESVDGTQHKEQLRQLAAFGKPIFIDKPLACSYADAAAILRYAGEQQVPVMTSSAVRHAPGIADALPENTRCHAVEAFGPMALLPDYRDYFWYGIHTAELLYNFLGTGCEEVRAFYSDSVDVIIGFWRDGRIGKICGNRIGAENFGCVLTTEHGSVPALASTTVPYFAPLLEKIMNFFRTGIPAVSNEESLEVIAFLEAAGRSRSSGGMPVRLSECRKKGKS